MRNEYTKLDWPSGTSAHRCPLCGSKPDLYQYVEKGDALKVVMCSHGEAFGPQSGIADEGCPFYMPPNAFYRPTIREAVRHWNEFADALKKMRLANDRVEQQPHDWCFENELPPWATGRAAGSYAQVGAQLCTRDGRRMGNAAVVDVLPEKNSMRVVTDFGNSMVLNLAEAAGLFHAPQWLMDINTHPGYQKFCREREPAQAQAHPCRRDGLCQYAIDHGAEGLGRCPKGKCVMPVYSGVIQGDL